MTALPNVVISVSDLAVSVDFYTNMLGFQLERHEPGADMAQVLDSDGDPLLLVGPRVGDIAGYAAERHRFLKPGDRLGFIGDDLDERRARLTALGVETTLHETRWGDRTLMIQGPDSYAIFFRTIAHRDQEETLALYRCVPDELDAALAGLSDADLDLTHGPGSWSIRQIVHHMGDSDALFLSFMRAALIESGRTYTHNWPGGYAAPFEAYSMRPIASAVAMVRTIRLYVLELAGCWEDAWERFVVSDTGRQESFGYFMNIMANHAHEHLDEIREIRKVHGR